MDNSIEVSQKTLIELPFDPAILLLGIYPGETINWKDTKPWQWEDCTATKELPSQVEKRPLEQQRPSTAKKYIKLSKESPSENYSYGMKYMFQNYI